MKKLGVCGDSYMASMSYDNTDLDNGYGKHFTELLAKKLKYEIITFARSGCSNQAIRLQIDEIIKEKPDLVIIGTTSLDRLEFPICDKLYENKNGLYNIDYRNFPNTSSEYEKFNVIEPKLYSLTFNDLFFGNRFNFNEYELNTLKLYFERIYDVNWKMQQDTWIISDGLRKLIDNNINFFCINNFLNGEDLSFFGDRIVYNKELNPWCYYKSDHNPKYWFHTNLEEQEMLFNEWYKFLLKHNINKLI